MAIKDFNDAELMKNKNSLGLAKKTESTNDGQNLVKPTICVRKAFWNCSNKLTRAKHLIEKRLKFLK